MWHDNDLTAYKRDSFVRGQKHYELKNHLGNVQVVVTDRKIGVDMDADSLVDFYLADLIYATDYYPFGLQIPERTYAARDSSTRYGFNEKEYDLWTSSLKIQDYGFRSYNPATARFMSVDPMTPFYPNRTPYNYADNTPIWKIDWMGLSAGEPPSYDGKSKGDQYVDPSDGDSFTWNGDSWERGIEVEGATIGGSKSKGGGFKGIKPFDVASYQGILPKTDHQNVGENKTVGEYYVTPNYDASDQVVSYYAWRDRG